MAWSVVRPSISFDVLTGYIFWSAADRTRIISEIERIYEASPTARNILDNFFAQGGVVKLKPWTKTQYYPLLREIRINIY